MSKDKIRSDIIRDVALLIREMAKIPKVKPLFGFLEESVLHLLGENEALPIQKIREALQISSDNLSHVLRALENYSAGKKTIPLIGRKTESGDTRYKQVFITRFGKKILADNLKRREQRLGILLTYFNEKDFGVFSELLKKMIRGVKEKI